MDAFKDFITKATELYLTAPAFFNWAAPLLLACIAGLIWFAFWLGSKLSESQIEQLKGKAEVLEQRVVFAKDRADAAVKEAKDTKAQLNTFMQKVDNLQKIDSQAAREAVRNAREALDHNINRLLSANTTTATVLGHISTGFDEHGKLKWRPLTSDEAYLDKDGEVMLRRDAQGNLIRNTTNNNST
jgi:hypothetical protein